MSNLPEVVQDFSEALQTDLKTADSMQIYVLTEIAQDNLEYAKEISKVICTRINTAPTGEKLYALYLLDSIAKKIGAQYIQEFSKSISDVFFYAYKQNKDIPNSKKSYLKLLSTWGEVFGEEKAKEIKNRIDVLEGGGQRVVQQQTQQQQPPQSSNSGMKRVGSSSDQSEQALLGTLLEKLQKNPELINDPQTASLFKQLTSKMSINLPQQIGRPNPYAPPNQSNTSANNPYSGNSSKNTQQTNQFSNIPSNHSMMQSSPQQQSNKPSSNPVHRLYEALTKQCMNCGVRFSSQKQLGEHLDVHQRKNQFFRNNKDLSRKWYSGEDEWIKLKDNDETEAIQCPGAIIFGEAESFNPQSLSKPSSTTALSAVDFFATFNTNKSKPKEQNESSGEIVANTEQDTCPVCHEELEKFYNSETAEWMLKGAVYDESCGLYVHQNCLSSSSKRKSDGDTGGFNKKLKQF